MPITTSFVISNAAKSFEATAYISAYEPYAKDSNLMHPKNFFTGDGIFENENGFFRPCPLFEVALIDEFLRDNKIDPANKDLYNTPKWFPGNGTNDFPVPVDRQCAEDGCTYRVQFKVINTNWQRLCISKRDSRGMHTRCCVLLLGIHLSVRGAPTLGQGSARGNTHQLHQPRRHMSTRSVSESPGVDFFV